MKVDRLLAGASMLGLIAAAPAPAPKQVVTGPVANYWASVGTNSGSGFGGMGQGGGAGRPSIGDMMKMMRGGTNVSHDLRLQLGSTRPATGEPKADHLPGTNPPLPLVTPQVVPASVPEESIEEQPTMPQKPKGRMLIYWGCGEHAGPGQPVVIDFAKIMDGQAMPRLPFVPVHHQNPPSPGRYKTYGEWPNSKSRLQPPASLVGAHDVKGNYSPDIHFSLPPGKDYMPPLVVNAQEKTPAGATKLVWQPVTNATGYFATMFGASPKAGGGGEQDVEIVMWSSSGISTFAGGGLLDYLAPAEVRRLIGQKVVMPPTQTQCVVPAEVSNAAKFGMLSMIAYGEEADFVDPPRPADPKIPWNINWTTKVRYKSTTGLMLGMPAMGGMGGGMGASAEDQAPAPSGTQSTPPPPPKKKKGGLFGTLQDLGAIPH